MIANLIGVLVLGVTVTVSVALYFLPVLVGALRRAPDLGSIAVLNFLLGWTLLGWVVALALALRSARPRGQVLQVVQNLPPAPAPALAPVRPFTAEVPPQPAPAAAPRPGLGGEGWAGPPGPPPSRDGAPPQLVLPPEPGGEADGYGALGEE